MSNPNAYQLNDYARMLTDAVRMEAYVAALRRAIKPDSVVLDLGTGTGFFAVLACKLGARKVFAIELSDSLVLGQEAAIANGCASSITYFQGTSFDISLPERVDIIVSDLRGVVPLYGRHIPTIVDARSRFLKPGGRLVPRRDTLVAAVISNADWYETAVEPFSRSLYRVDTSCVTRFLCNRFHRVKIRADQLLTDPARCLDLDYRTVTDPQLDAALQWTVTAPGQAHGIGLWFDAELDEQSRFSTQPGQPDTIYGRGLLPWPRPVPLQGGDSVQVALKANLVDQDYVWRWNTRVEARGHPARVKAEFRQSTWSGTVVSPRQLGKLADGFVPSLSVDGEVEYFVLSLIQKGASLADIAAEVSARFPNKYPRASDAMGRVRAISWRHGQ